MIFIRYINIGLFSHPDLDKQLGLPVLFPLRR